MKMKKNCILVILLAAVLGLSGCDRLGQLLPQKETQMPEESEQLVEIDMEDGIPFIETDAGEVSLPADTSDAGTEDTGGMGNESEEEFMVVPDTETEEMAASAETESEAVPEPVDLILSEVVKEREALGEHWAVGYEDLDTGAVCGYRDTDVMQSASVVKLFIMGAVYRYMCYPPEGEDPLPFGEEYEGQLRETIEKMITVSDNDAANLLIERLGGGEFEKGAELIRTFCEENGYTGTSVGRRFLEENPTGDNYTTASDTRKFLSDICHGLLINEEASEKMLTIVKGQTRKNKIPAGLPEGFTSGNKTGEMPEGYGLGCIENDCAIVFPPEGQGSGYVLTVLSNDLGGRNDEAIAAITKISSVTADWYLNGMKETEAS